MKLTKGKVIGMLCAGIGALIGALFDDYAQQIEIREAVEEYMTAKEKREAKRKDKEVD